MTSPRETPQIPPRTPKIGPKSGPKNPKFLSRLGELLNTQKNVHFFAPPGAPGLGWDFWNNLHRKRTFAI